MLRRRLLSRGIAVRGLLLVALTVGLVLGAGAASASPRVHGIPFASGSTKTVVVLLKDKAAGLGARTTARANIVRSEVGPLADKLRSRGATHVTSGTKLPFVVASVTSAQEQALKQSAAVKAVFPNAVITESTPQTSSATQLASPLIPNPSSSPTPVSGPKVCPSNPSKPENDPEALSVINAGGAKALDINGAGVTVGYIAGSINTANPDFQRNGSSIVTQENFAGDDNLTTPPFDIEAYIDAGSIAAQGKTVYDLSQFVSAANPLPPGCNITITGTAPRANVMGLDVFSTEHQTTTSNFVQAINFAAAHGVKVLNESFGSNGFPDTAQDAVRIADDDAVAAGVTVVVSSGDAGVTSTLGSPSTDPKLISVGASTTFRAYQQDTFGGINATSPNKTNGTWLDNNISSLSSGGFSQSGGNTVNLVAPGDLNWILCDVQTCANDNGDPSPIDISGGTSESSPLTAGAAADVIQAYRHGHHGASPSPALVKQILTSSATDIDAPAEQQGAGLLNIGAAVKMAESVNGGSGQNGSLLIGPNQINITQDRGHGGSAHQPVTFTNTGNKPVQVHLSTRTLDNEVDSKTGSFCLNPDPNPSDPSCGPPTANTFAIWSGAIEVYQEVTFTVPKTNRPSRLNFTSNYPFTGQGSLLHVALYDPSGAYATYSDPQGLANYANEQVTNPKPGTWTAVFFTFQDTSAETGTSGIIQWQADTFTYGSGGHIDPGTLNIAPGQTRSAWFTPQHTNDPGDLADSIVVNSSDGTNTTVPVTVRTLVDTHHGWTGGTFNGVLTGGNGRGPGEGAQIPSQTNTYAFDVRPGQRDLDASVVMPNGFDDGVEAFLVDPEGNAVASSSNDTLDSTQQNLLLTNTVDVYKDNPQAGRWMLILDWAPVNFGPEFSQLSAPFTGRIRFNHVAASSDLPSSHSGPHVQLQHGQTYTFNVKVKNTGAAPQAFWLDPRLNSMTTMSPADQGGPDTNISLPLSSGQFPWYLVPTNTSSVKASLTPTSSVPVTFDMSPFSGDPDIEATSNGNSASATYHSGDEAQSGPWGVVPSEFGPYPSSGAPTVHANATFSVTTKAFDSTVNPSTGDMWLFDNGLTSSFTPVYLDPGQSATIPLTITPSASSGTHVTGNIDVDDAFQVNPDESFFTDANADELASLPFSYTVK
jgi:hypothetical protein